MPKGGGIVATIKSQMVLNDGMSSVLKKITSALDLTLASFEQVQRASGNAVDVANIEAARAGLVDAGNAVDEMAENYRRAAQEEEKLNRGIREGTSALDGMVTKAVSLAGTYMSLSAIKGFITDSMESADVQIGAQVQLRTVMGNMGTLDYYDQILDKAAGIQSRGMYGDEAMIAGAGELATYFSDGEAILSMMDTLTNYATGMFNGKALDASAMVDYATGLGKIMSGSYDAMTKKGFEFSDTQKAIIEGTATEAQIVASLGEEYVSLSNDMQAAAVIGNVVNEGWAGLYEAMSNTPEGQVISFNNALGDIQETVGAGIYPAVLNLVQMVQSNLPKINTAAMGVATMLGFVITLLTGMVEGALVFGTAVSDNWSWISPIVMGIVAALAAYAAISAAVAIANGIHAASETTKAAAQAMATGATFAETAAQYGLNAALLACPVTWVILAIIALISVIYAAVGAFNHFAGASVSATGIVMGAFAVLGAFILNNTVIPIYNGFARLANFLGNVFNDPVAAVQVAFYDMALTVIGYIANLAHGIEDLVNKIPGVTVDITSGLDGFYAGLEQAQQAVKDESGWIEYVQKMNYIDYRDAASAGYAFGQGIENKVGGLLDSFSYVPGSIEDLLDRYGYSVGEGLANDVGAIADNTDGMAGALEVSGEELKYLRDIAERDAINRFTTAKIEIDMTGMTNKIEGGADVDSVIHELTEGFSEALVTAAEGVHGS